MTVEQAGPQWALRQPIAWASLLMAIATLVAVTGRSTSDPGRNLALAIVGAGISVSLASWPFKDWWLAVAGVALVGWGVGIIIDPTLMLAGWIPATVVAVMAISVYVAWPGKALASSIAAVLGAVSVLMAFFQLDVLFLLVSLSMIFVTAVWSVGFEQARQSGGDETLSTSDAVRYARRWLLGRVELAEDVDALHHKLLFEGPDAPRRIGRFHILMGFASAIASFGVVTDSTAVVIGAMLIAPLMTPLLGTSLSLVMGWPNRLARSLALAASGAAIAVTTGVLVSAMAGLGTDVESNTQIASRVTPTLLDLGIAVAAGSAGAYALSRRDVSDSLPGVAVAIALVPPLAVVGVAAQLGAWGASLGALLLFATNALAIFGMGALTFVLTGAAASRPGAAEDDRIRPWSLGILVGGVVVIGALLANGASLSVSGFRQDRAEAVVADWIGDRSYEVDSVEVDDEEVVVRIAGPDTPDDADVLAESLAQSFETDVSLDLRVVIQEIVETPARFAD